MLGKYRGSINSDYVVNRIFSWRVAKRYGPAVTLIAVCLFAYGSAGPHIGWITDDYNEVFGCSAQVPDWRSAFTIGGVGHWTIFRFLKYPMEGYLGYWLGPGRAHIVQFICHVACTLLFFSLLRRLRWHTAPALAAGMLFSSSPWISQAVYWWAAASAIWSTLAILAGGHALITWCRLRLLRWYIAYVFLVLVGLAVYELWLGGFIFFLVIDYHVEHLQGHRLARSGAATAHHFADLLSRGSIICAPFLLYGFLYRIAPSPEVTDRLRVDIRHLPSSLAMLHLRAVQWLIDTQWSIACRNACRTFSSQSGVLCLAAFALTVMALGYLWIVRLSSDGSIYIKAPLWLSLLLAWSIFLGSRITLVMQGYISRFDTRENYAANMGVALASVALLSAVLRHGTSNHLLRKFVGILVLFAVCVLGWTSAGIGVHYAATSAAESATISQLIRWLSKLSPHPRGITTVVVAPPNNISQGSVELSYFSFEDGAVLDSELRPHCSQCSFFVVREINCVQGREVILLHDSPDRNPPTSQGLLALDQQTYKLRWDGQHLLPDDTSCK